MLIFLPFGDDLLGFRLKHFLLGIGLHEVYNFVVEIPIALCLFFKPIKSQLAAAFFKVLADRVVACEASHRKSAPIWVSIVFAIKFKCLCHMVKGKTFIPERDIRLNLRFDLLKSLSFNWVLLQGGVDV